jgi:hypothetical protein
MAMLDGVEELTLAMLNEATQAWAEHEYNQTVHSETGDAPLARFLAGPSVARPSPDSTALRLAFTRTEQRLQRKSDGTIVLEGRRFEVPDRYRHLSRLELRFASWDLGYVHLVDDQTGAVLCRLFPQDKVANANALRRTREPVAAAGAPPHGAGAVGTPAIAPLLAQLIEQQRSTGLPAAYLPKDDGEPE